MEFWSELKHARRHSHGASFTGHGLLRAHFALTANRSLIPACPRDGIRMAPLSRATAGESI